MSKTRMAYDKDLINREVIAVCDYYLTHRRGEGKRQTYQCPVCGDRNFEVDPVMGYAGCFDAACEAPTTTDALGIIAYFEGNPLSGEGFVRCLKKGYEILGLDDPEEGGEDRPGPESSGGRAKAISPRNNSRKKRAITPRTAPEDRRSKQATEEWAGAGASGEYAGPKWGAAATADPASDGHTTGLEQPIQAWQENTDGSRSAIAAVVIHEEESNGVSGSAEHVEDTELATYQEHSPGAGEASQAHNSLVGDERQKAHEVFEALLKMCRLEERDERFLLERGLDEAAIEEGRFGSFSKDRCDYVLGKLDQRFSREELLSVPGFYETKSGSLRFSLYGDYVLIPYLDNEGYIRTVEGRFTGEEMGEYDKRYKALLGSAVHLYVHPRYKPEEVVAVCEGAIGAMVAARYGFAVAAIKGFRNYRARSGEDQAIYTVLPELSGVDFAGKEVVYIPDLDVKPKSYVEVMKAVPHACNWLIQRQGGIPKVAMLPEGAKDLDAWILSLDEEERETKIEELLDGAIPVERFEQKYLDSGLPEKDRQPEFEELGGGDEDSVSGPGQGHIQGEPGTAGEGSVDGDSDPEDQQSSEESGKGGVEEGRQQAPTNSQRGTDSSHLSSRDYETGEDEQYASGGPEDQTQLSTTDGSQQNTRDENGVEDDLTKDDTTELEIRHTHQQSTDDRRLSEGQLAPEDDGGSSPPVYAHRVRVKGERHLLGLVYVIAALILSVAAWMALGGALAWAGSLVLGAGLAIPVVIGFSKFIGWYNGRRLRRHIEGN